MEWTPLHPIGIYVPDWELVFPVTTEKESKMKLTRVGIDLAKNVFQVHGVDEHGKLVWKRCLKRATWLQVLLDKAEPSCVIGMEACGGIWARRPQHMSPLRQAIPGWLEDAENGLTDRFRSWLHGLWNELLRLDQRRKALDAEIEHISDTHPGAKRLKHLRGVGPLVSTALVARFGDGRHFKRGRQAAASVGLTPRHHGTGGKNCLYGITKQGDRYLRSILIHGARAAVWQSKRRDDRMTM